MRISYWSSDVCSSDLAPPRRKCAPDFFTPTAVFTISSSFSTVFGPAITGTSLPPNSMPAHSKTVRWSGLLLATSGILFWMSSSDRSLPGNLLSTPMLLPVIRPALVPLRHFGRPTSYRGGGGVASRCGRRPLPGFPSEPLQHRGGVLGGEAERLGDRKSTRLNSSH